MEVWEVIHREKCGYNFKVQNPNFKSNPKSQRKVAWQQRCFTQCQKIVWILIFELDLALPAPGWFALGEEIWILKLTRHLNAMKQYKKDAPFRTSFNLSDF